MSGTLTEFLQSGAWLLPALVVGVIVCLAGCFYFAGSEIALLSLDRSFVSSCKDRGVKGASAALTLISGMSATLSLILLGTNAFNSATSALITMLLERVHEMVPWLKCVNISVLTTVVATPLMLIFGEVVPKAIGMNRPAGFSFRIAPSMLVMRRTLRFILRILEAITSVIARPFGGRDSRNTMAREEVEVMTAMGRDDGVLSEDECRLIRRTMDFSNQTLASVMTPMAELNAFPADMAVTDFLDATSHAGEILFPVYDGRPDRVEGVVTKHLALRMALSQPEARLTLGDIMYRSIIYAPEIIGADVLIRHLGQGLSVIVFAVDEYGAVTGMMTSLDVAEEIVGSLMEAGPHYVLHRNPDGSVECDARVDAEQVGEALSVNLDRQGYNTIGGFILKNAGRIPKTGETFSFGKLKLTVLSATSRRLGRVRVEKA